MVSILGKMEIDMKESGNNVSSMDKVQIYLVTEIHIQENIKMESLMVEVSILGKMDRSMLESLKMV